MIHRLCRADIADEFFTQLSLDGLLSLAQRRANEIIQAAKARLS